MKLKHLILLFLTYISSISVNSQVTEFNKKFELPSIVEETSGLLFLDGKIITHNDSGDEANLYELSNSSGNLLRTININNASNVDWEDITEDNTHIYIGDFGNNNGTRTDLKIYKILKSDFKKNNSISADIISFSYEDQKNFSNSNNHNFDAEAFVVYDNQLLIFTKNRADFQTNVYKIPNIAGAYSATKVSNANVEGLITGATFCNNNFMLCGYSTTAIPFLIYISSNRNSGNDIFNSGFEKHILNSEVEQRSQIEAITSFEDGKFYLSRERVNNSFVNLPQKLYEFKDERTKVLSSESFDIDKIKILPNPTSNLIRINSKKKIKSITIFNTIGKKVLSDNSPHQEINISHLLKGIYVIKVQFNDTKSYSRKIIKL
ncbi:T9SS type A sorting domain-containing protein [Polaribacter ponticola]|uniref:T9SS type A sorting domain-containing protein n=1 Tax=Polaribacter ponticola TaxID=2978475 RepID=A0ABT5S9C4_9FLAO|nr:T9SS type A sorting domain-containing protein [Polaribacter sp. MSW5]MDD7914709.1 T9SS type A sorting domain-containing protein [Polaribacter sp. MSW5]